ncbi:MAG: hypothetical protein ACYTF9_16390 [Planctomycetota bacterium]|jgi:hypothetical protein
MLSRLLITTLLVAATLSLGGCPPPPYDPALATTAYPERLHLVEVTQEDGVTVRVPRIVDIQVFREQEKIIIVNATPTSYRDFDLWINQRFVSRVDQLRAGETVKLSLWRFYDEYGEVFNAGGLFRTIEPTPLVLVEIQVSEDEPLIGLITIREPTD